MARRFPRPLARRDVLYGPDTPRERLVELARAYLEEDLLFDAADFFCEARDREGLEIIKSRAQETGDAFLLRQVQQTCPNLVSKADWDDLAARAREIGKDIYADRAQAGGAPPPPPLEEEKVEGGEDGAGEEAAGEDDVGAGRTEAGDRSREAAEGARHRRRRGRRRRR